MGKDNPFIKRNPLIIPEPEVVKKGCPKCKSEKFSGRNIQGAYTFTCLNDSCRTQWQGGYYTPPVDPKKPIMPINPKDKPSVVFDYDPRQKDAIEINYPVDLTQEFRKGALVVEEDEDEWQ